MKIYVVPFILIVLMTAACKNKQQQPVATTTDSTTNTSLIKSKDSTTLRNSNTYQWIAHQLQQKDFDWQHLQLHEHYKNDSLAAEDYFAEDEFYENYQSVLRWSPDRSYVLDLGSYGSILVKDDSGKIRVEAGEPDSEVALLQPEQNKKWSLFFVGPSSNIFDGTWVDKDNLVVLGSFNENATGAPDTLFWMVNVKDQFYRMYKWKR